MFTHTHIHITYRTLTYLHTYIQSSPYFDPTHTRKGWIGQPLILNRHEVVTIDGDVYVCMYDVDTLGLVRQNNK